MPGVMAKGVNLLYKGKTSPTFGKTLKSQGASFTKQICIFLEGFFPSIGVVWGQG